MLVSLFVVCLSLYLHVFKIFDMSFLWKGLRLGRKKLNMNLFQIKNKSLKYFILKKNFFKNIAYLLDS